MTKEKAIELLEEIIDEGWLISDLEKCDAIEACEMAIKALEQESTDDLSSKLEKNSKKLDKYEYHTDHTDCIWYGSDSSCPVTCSQYRDGWNDAMDYIFKDGKGYQPYKREEDKERTDGNDDR